MKQPSLREIADFINGIADDVRGLSVGEYVVAKGLDANHIPQFETKSNERAKIIDADTIAALNSTLQTALSKVREDLIPQLGTDNGNNDDDDTTTLSDLQYAINVVSTNVQELAVADVLATATVTDINTTIQAFLTKFTELLTTPAQNNSSGNGGNSSNVNQNGGAPASPAVEPVYMGYTKNDLYSMDTQKLYGLASSVSSAYPKCRFMNDLAGVRNECINYIIGLGESASLPTPPVYDGNTVQQLLAMTAQELYDSTMITYANNNVSETIPVPQNYAEELHYKIAAVEYKLQYQYGVN